MTRQKAAFHPKTTQGRAGRGRRGRKERSGWPWQSRSHVPRGLSPAPRTGLKAWALRSLPVAAGGDGGADRGDKCGSAFATTKEFHRCWKAPGVTRGQPAPPRQAPGCASIWPAGPPGDTAVAPWGHPGVPKAVPASGDTVPVAQPEDSRAQMSPAPAPSCLGDARGAARPRPRGAGRAGAGCPHAEPGAGNASTRPRRADEMWQACNKPLVTVTFARQPLAG